MRQVKHLAMISLDAVDNEDMAFLKTLPHFGALTKRGTLVEHVAPTFVTNTYPIHSSIITGVYPDKHGLIENLKTQPGNEHPDWNTQAELLRAPTLYQKAAEAGLAVCSILYPVTEGASTIRYHIPEIPGHMPLLRRARRMLKGNAGYLLGCAIRNLHHKKRRGVAGLDDLTTACAIDTLRRKRPNLLLLHLLDVDTNKHEFGPKSREAKEALTRMDERVGRLAQTMEQLFLPEEYGLIVFSDHGCLPVNTAVDPNDVLKQYGLIREPAKAPGDFDAFFHNAGGSAFCKLYRPEKLQALEEAISALLKEPYAARLLTEEEMRAGGFSGSFAYGIEAAEGYCFGKFHLGQHGYALKSAGYRPFYLAAGPSIEENRILSGGCVVDICPLAAELLGLPLWEMDGKNRIR